MSPIDAVSSYGSFLFQTSQVDAASAAALDNSAKTMAQLLSQGKFDEATAEWSAQQNLMESASGNGTRRWALFGADTSSQCVQLPAARRGRDRRPAPAVSRRQ